jgi:hypothetical protein
VTWTYSGNPSSTTRDEVRFLTGDTDTNDQLVTDEEIAYAVAKAPEPALAAARVCDAIAAKFARQADASAGDVSESASQKAAAYRTLATELRTQAGALALPVFGGITQAEKQTLDEDTGAVQPSFRIGQDDNPRAPSERRSNGPDDPFSF